MESTSRDGAAETAFGIAAVLTGGGALTFARFPFLLPTVVLLGALALPLLPLAALGAVLFGGYVALRALARLVGRRPARARLPEPSTRIAELRADPR